MQFGDRPGGEQQFDVERSEDGDHAQLASPRRDQGPQCRHRLSLQPGTADRDQRAVGDALSQLVW